MELNLKFHDKSKFHFSATMWGATNMEEKLEILHEIEMKKRLIDGLEETHIPIFFRSFGDSEWEMMKELEETFYFPPEQYSDDFQVWKCFPMGYLRFTGYSKEDGTKTTALWRMGQLMPFEQPVLFLIKKTLQTKKRLDFVMKKYGAKLEDAKEGPNQGFLKNNPRKKTRDPIESRLRHEVFKRDSYKCVECGKTNKETTLHADHILPVAQGGKDELENLQTLCQACNLAKSNKCWNAEK
jgi:5-methylcytosine-specific restriction enzyme A